MSLENLDLKKVMLGKGPRKHDVRTPRFAKYVATGAPTPPATCGYSSGITNWGMMLNGPNTYGNKVPSDGLGDCTCAGACHGLQTVSAKATAEVTEPDSIVLGLYEKWCGYVPGDSGTDNGGVCLDILNDWKAQGIGGQKLDAFAQIHLMGTGGGVNVPGTDIMRAIWMFGGAYIGVQLPVSAQNQTKTWELTTGPDAEPGSWGGHCIYLIGYSPHTLTCVTWGEKMEMTWGWFNTYCDEAYACVMQDWFKTTGVDPTGVNLAQLTADLSYIEN